MLAPEDSGATLSAGTDVRGALKEALSLLRAAEVPSPILAAELLLMHTLERDRTWLYTHPDERLDSSVIEKYFALVARRVGGEPTQYLTGKQEFWALEFQVSPAVLIPRPETEHVMEVALERLGPRGIKIDLKTGAPAPSLQVADVGTGSGCLAVALAHELPHAEIVATDISAPALEVARNNAAQHGVANRIRFLQTDLLEAVRQELRASTREPRVFDLIVSNPPYIGLSEAPALPREVRDHEPALALFGGPTGIEIYARLIDQAASLLRGRGVLVLELGHGAADIVRRMFHVQQVWANVGVTNDLAGISRVIAAERV